jgi:cell division transport system permease protein
MIGYRFATARRELPLGRDQSARFLPWIVALMVYIAGLGGVGLIVVDDTLRASEQALATSLTLQVPAETSKARLETVLALVRQTSGILSVHLLEPAETARLLEPWLGSAVPLDELPVPRLIDLRRDPKGRIDVAALRQQLAAVVPDARLDDHLPWLDGMRAAARRIEGLLAAGIAVALLLVAASSVFAVRTALMADRSAAKLLHVLGAADSAIGRGFAIRSLRLGLVGGVIGAVAALLTIVVLGGADSAVQLPAPIAVNGIAANGIAANGIAANGIAANGIAANGIADWRFWAVLSGTVLAAGLIAMASAWASVLRRLATMP